MSTFFSNLFGGSKTKTKKEKPKEPQATHKSEENHDEHDNLPVLNRRLSLSKSGRMKEKKRKNISVMKNGDESQQVDANHQTQEKLKDNLPSSDVFDVEGIERAEKEHANRMEKY